MSAALEYDDTNLRKLFAELQPKRRKQALKGGARRTAAKVRRTAVTNLRASMNSNSRLEKGVRIVVFKRVVGFSVTIRPGKSNRGYYLSSHRRDGRYLPVLKWAETGTRDRFRRGKRSFLRHRRGGSTGRMPELGFMETTRSHMSGEITASMRSEIETSIRRIAQKYGCT